MIATNKLEKYVEQNKCGLLILVISLHLPGKSEENLENPQSG
jgi:hypothetical protein